ncbi:MAG: 3'-5' exonuclease [Xanthomonadaceae bacterium]|jgi:DNA polymerase-3 subunit epsilon|nr:3'-5' exonuclease [Xanthomonadaceae bacterium]
MFPFKSWRRRWLRSQLTNPEYAFLFDSPPADEYVSLDCETSSLDPRNAELLCIAAVRVIGNRIALSQRLELIVRPQGDIDPRTIPIHGLRQQDVDTGLSPQDAIGRLLHFIGARPLIGYYLEFDLAVIDRYLKPWLGISLPNQAVEVSSLYYDRHVSAYRPEVDLALDSILRQLELPHWPRHDALYDSVTAAAIWLKLKYSKKRND